MSKILFWNLNKKTFTPEVVSICHEHDVDILLLAESVLNTNDVLLLLNSGQKRMFISPFNPSKKIQIYIRYTLDCYNLIYDDTGVAVRRIAPPVGLDFTIVAVHLPSKLYMKDNEQAINAIRVARIIDEIEDKVGHDRTIVIGDLNMNPFEDGVVAADGFHAVMDRKIATKKCRTVQGTERKYFYNPMWGNMGDSSPGPPGTYFYQGGQVSYFWNTFDQALLRPSLLEYFPEDGITIISKVGNVQLTDVGIGIDPTLSDHLPLLLKINIENGGIL
jgi:hypothetical protein